MKQTQIHLFSGFLLFLVSICNLKAQNLKFGLGAGLNLVDAHLDNQANSNYDMIFDPKPGFNINGIISYHWNEKWSIAAEPGYNRRGYNYEINEPGFSTAPFNRSDNTISFHHIQLPVLASYRLFQKFSTIAGLELSHWLGPELAGNKWEYSVSAGFSYHYSDSWSLGAKYNHGISPVYRFVELDNSGTYVDELKLYNQYLQLMVRYTI